MMKSAKSAKDNKMNKAKSEFQQNSEMGKKKQKQYKWSKQRGKIINNYFRDAESLGHVSEGSNKISNLIEHLGDGEKSYSGQSFKPHDNENSKDFIIIDDSSPLQSVSADNKVLTMD
jgi:hypothetical protein